MAPTNCDGMPIPPAITITVGNWRAGRALLAQLVDLAGEPEVVRGEAAGGMGDQGQGYLVPLEEDVGVMVSALGEKADGGHEQQRVLEVLSGDRAGELAVRDLPPGRGGEFRRDLVLWH